MTMPNLTARHSAVVAVVLAFASGCGGGYDYVASKAPSGGASYYPSAPPPAQQAYPADAPKAEEAPQPIGSESFKDYGVNPFVETSKDRLSTFSIDVDTASYSFARRRLMRENMLPAYQGVRAEEFLNSFDYGYETPTAQDTTPFKVSYAAAPAPFTPGHHLVRVGVQAKRITAQERSPVHLVYLVDTSGSMGPADRLPLAKKGLAMLTETLKPGDTVALCTYAGDTRTVLEPTGVENKQKILAAIQQLGAGGGTAMASGIENAYSLASRTLVKGHVNRIVVLSDGDANIGHTGHEALLKTIAQYKDKGITLSTVGFGSGNYKDTTMEQLADKGDGNYTYIDSEQHARTVFATQADRLLQGVARDVKAQVDFDPEVVQSYRLIGYENRDVRDRDFRNDAVDGGEVGAGHTVTAMYDVVLRRTDASPLTVRVRYKSPRTAMHGGSERATEEAYAMPPSRIASAFRSAPESLRFATAVAGFAEVLRQSPLAREWSLSDVARIGEEASAGRPERRELVALVQSAARLRGERPSVATVGIAR